MIDARDPGTVSMPLDVKRGRGRPRKPDALTPAERAKRYRQKRVMVPFDRLGVSDDLYDDQVRWREDAERVVCVLRAELDQARAEIERLTLKLSERGRDVTNNDLVEAQLSAQHWQGEADLWRRAAAQLAEEGSRLIPRHGPIRRAVAEGLLQSLRDLSCLGEDVAGGRDVT